MGCRHWNLLTDDGGDVDGLCAARYIRRPTVDRFLSLGIVLRITLYNALAWSFNVGNMLLTSGVERHSQKVNYKRVLGVLRDVDAISGILDRAVCIVF